MTIITTETLPARVFPDDDHRGRLLLQTWFSPAFPIGGFAYSQGLESAVEAGLAADEAALSGWIGDLFQFGSIANDLIVASCSWQACQAESWDTLAAIAEFGSALQPSAERYSEALTQGGSFLAAIGDAWPCEGLAAALDRCHGTPLVYAVATGLVAAAHGLRCQPALEAFALSFASNQVSAGIRLGVIGQTGAQRILASLMPAIADAAARAAVATLDDIGSASFSADLFTIEHETQYTRLFRT